MRYFFNYQFPLHRVAALLTKLVEGDVESK
jgi:hypothetical protein